MRLGSLTFRSLRLRLLVFGGAGALTRRIRSVPLNPYRWDYPTRLIGLLQDYFGLSRVPFQKGFRETLLVG